MPEGRFISKTIAHSEDLAGVSFHADYLFTRCIPHLDREGRMTGNAELVKAIAVPLRKEITAETIPALLAELADAKVIIWYEVGGKPVIQFTGFDKHQRGIKKDREAPSRFPPPDDEGATLIRPASCEGPAKVLSDAGVSAAKLDRSEVEVKSKLSPSEVKKPSAAVASVSEPVRDPDAPDRRQKPRRSSRSAASPPQEKSERESWLTPAGDAWEETFGAGSFDYGRNAKVLAPLHRAGVEPAEIGRRLREYIRQRRGKFCTLADFATHHGEYVPVDRGPALLPGGVLSAYGEELTRPDGMPAPKGWYS